MYIGGIDVGTSGCKIAVFDKNGALCEVFYEEYEVTRKGGHHEVNFNVIFDNVKKVLKSAALKYKLVSVGVTSFGETFAMLDKDDNIIAPSMLYTDVRGESECKYLENALSAETIALKTGVMPHSMYSLPKVMWIKNNMPDAYAKADKVLLGEDYVVYMLTGNRQIDYSLAARTLAFNIRELAYDDEILSAVGVDKALFSTPVKAGTVAGNLKAELKNELGIDYDITVVNGCHDQIAAMTGSGVFSADTAMDGIGTVECMTFITDTVPNDAEFYKGGYSVVPHINGKYACYALSFAGGATLKWFRDNIVPLEHAQCKANGTDIYAELDKKVKDDPTGILILPHFAGAATPYMDSFATATVTGLTFEHDRYDIYKALMEGTSFEMLLNLDYFGEKIKIPQNIRASGGGSMSDVWLQIKADILNIEVIALDCSQIGAAGTAMLAGKAMGVYTEDVLKTMAPTRKVFTPNLNKHNVYKQMYKKYSRIYDALKG